MASHRTGAHACLVAVVSLIASTGCNDLADPPTFSERQAALEAARDLWERSGIVEYVYPYRRFCERFPIERTSPAIEVRPETIVRVWNEQTGESVREELLSHYFTVTDLFRLIEHAVRQGVDKLDVQYHPTLCHPTATLIDYPADE